MCKALLPLALARSLTLALLLATVLAPGAARAGQCDSELLIVLDRSCSMQTVIKDPMTGKSDSKWNIAVAAIEALAAKYGDDLQLGLTVFPDKAVKTTDPKCTQAADAIPPADNNATKISTLLSMTQPDGPCVTNIDQALYQASLEPTFKDRTRRSFVLLITDGMQSDGCDGGPAKADPLTVSYIQTLYKDLVPTYVVGFDAAASASSLNQFAVAGGLPDPTGMYKFYLASSQTDLNNILNTVGGNVAGTEFGCTGMPCPDNRCLSADQYCIDGTCQNKQDGQPQPAQDMAPVTGDGATGQPGQPVQGGCGCRVAGRGQGGAGPAAAVLLVCVGLWLSTSRRRSR